MSTYVMSGIYGMYEMFRRMLFEIKFNHTDQLYILGNVIDHGPNGIKLLLNEIINKPNIHLIYGNHEKMMIEVIAPKDIRRRFNSMSDWINNGGETTIDAYDKLSTEERKQIINFLKSIPYSSSVVVNKKKYCLVHAWPSKNMFDLLWHMPRRNENPHLPKGVNLIIGHTPTAYWHYDGSQEGLSKYVNDLIKNNDHLHIEHAPHFMGIDCGAYWTSLSVGRLACLRLDDMKEFYISQENALAEES